MSSICKICGKHGGMCIHARMSDALKAHEDDQPDAMDQGVHVALNEIIGGIVCDCGKALQAEEWEAHCESEGE